VIVTDEHGRPEWVNAVFCSHTGYSLAEIRGRELHELLHGPDTSADTAAEMARATTAGEPFTFDVLHYRKSGEQYWALVESEPTRDEAGKLTGYISIHTDITEHRIEVTHAEVTRRIGDQLLTSRSIAQAAEVVAQELVRAYDIRTVSVWTVEPEQSTLQYVTGAISDPSCRSWMEVTASMSFAAGTEWTVGVGAPGVAWGTAAPCQKTDFLTQGFDGRYSRRSEAARRTGIRTLCAVPVMGSEGVLAVIEFGGSHTFPGYDQLPALLEQVALLFGAFITQTRTQRALSALFEASPDALLVVDADGAVSSVNLHAITLFGYVVGISLTSLLDDAPALLRQNRQDTAGLVYQGVARHIDGTTFDAEFTISRSKGIQTTADIVSVRDLTERRKQQAEVSETKARLQTILETLPESLVILDEAGRVVETNSAGLSLLEVDAVEQARGRAFMDFIAPEHRAQCDALCQRALAGETIQLECEVVGLKGRRRWLSTKAVRMAYGVTMHVLVTTTDITERKIAEKERLALEARVRESQKLEAVVQLTAGLAHDFNNLLGIVVGGLDEIGARMPEDDATLRHLHQTAMDAVLRGVDVTRSLLAVARSQPLEVASYDVNALLTEILPLCKTSAGSTVSLRSDLTSGVLLARLDVGGLSNVVLNLVINARDALRGKSGEHRIMLRTRRELVVAGPIETLPPGWYAVIEVADTGSGMDEQTKARVFEPFFTTKERGHGTGLGLAMVYGYVSQLGGTARIHSEPGHGTTVQLYLPLDATAHLAAEAAESARLRALYDKQILDTAPEAAFDALVAEAARICKVPIALVTLVDENRQWFKAKVGLEVSQTPREQAFCAHAIVGPSGVLVVPDAHKDPRFSGNPLVTGDPNVRFYAGIVLRDAAGAAMGTLCVIDRVPRELSAVQLAQLDALAEQAAVLIRARLDTPSDQPDAAAAPRRVLVVDDEEALCQMACAWLESLGYETVGVDSPAAALERLAAASFDILFTDILMPGDMDGIALAREAQSRQPGLRVVLTSGYAPGLVDAPDLVGKLITKPYRKKDLLKHFVARPPAVG
jgi:PAS domain S-box-containing protein